MTPSASQRISRNWPLELCRPFQLIVFDWDGKAVIDRISSANELAQLLDSLLSSELSCAMITGTKMENLYRQCISLLAPQLRTHLYVCSNRGSEVYSFSKTGQPVLLEHRTDKSDSVHWLYEHVILPRKIQIHSTVFFGDEFGPVGGFQGSDSLMQIPGLEQATFVSVGKEPEGVPKNVIHLGGGPPRFLEFLKYQSDLKTTPSHELHTSDPTWLLEQEGFDPNVEREMETLFTIGNGYLGVRGSSSIPLPTSQADLFVAGIYDKKAPSIPYSELTFYAEGDSDDPYQEIVSIPSPFRLSLKIDKNEIFPGNQELQQYKRTLDMSKGLLLERFIFYDTQNNPIDFDTFRCASLRDLHFLFEEIEILSQSSSADIELNTKMSDSEFSLRHPHLVLKTSAGNTVLYETKVSRLQICVATRITINDQEHQDSIICLKITPQIPVRVRRWTVVYTSRDTQDLMNSTLKRLNALQWNVFEEAVENSFTEWEQFWRKADIQLEGNPSVQHAQRFNNYHLRIAADHDPTVSVGAKALTGRAYEGHIFWDADIFSLPFYLYNTPEIAKSLLLFRYHTLDGARQRAKTMGCKGACYPWESTIRGTDVTPSTILLKGAGKVIPIYTGQQQLHVTADVAYSIWCYWDNTLDDSFMYDYGAEILIETARFWANRAVSQNGYKDGLFHILNVIGPDEYHHDVNDNAYTNWMAKYNLEKAAWVIHWMQSRSRDHWIKLRDKIHVEDTEIEQFVHVAENLYIQKPGKDGVIEQFENFFKLKEFSLSQSELLKPPIQRLFESESINQSKVIKQADVLMIFFLFPNLFSREIMEANYDYYSKLTDHGSSLSPCVHAAVAARIGKYEDAQRFFENSLNLDLLNLMGNTALGIHLACAGGTWQALVFHILDIRFDDPIDSSIDPSIDLNDTIIPSAQERWLPLGLQKVELQLTYRNRLYPIRVYKEQRAITP